MPTTAALVAVTTGAAIKTMLQVQAGTTKPLKIKEWGISFDGAALATPIKVELIETDVAATVTTLATTSIHKVDGEALSGGDPVTNLVLVGTAATGFTASAEGTITVVRYLDTPKFILPVQPLYEKQFPLGDEPVIQVSKFMRIRVTLTGTAVNCYCYVKVMT